MSWLLATLSGVLGVLAYPNASLWPLIFVCWAPLMVALEDKGGRSRFFHGWLTGTIAMAGGHFFIAATLVNMAGLPWWAAVLVLLLYAGWCGLQWALFAWVYGFARQLGDRGVWLVTVPLLFSLIERVFPAFFPFYASNALWEAPILLQSLEWIGPSGLSALIIGVQCALVHSVEEYSRGRASDHFVPTAVAALWLALSVWGVVRMRQIQEAPIKAYATVALVQPNMTVSEKRDKDWSVRERVWERTVAMSRKAAALDPDLIVWPEGAFPFKFEAGAHRAAPANGDTLHTHYSRLLYRLGHELKRPLVAGGLRWVDGRVRNGAVFFAPGAEPVPYDKRRLVMLAERVPFGDTWPGLVEAVPGASHYAPGEAPVQWEAAGLRWTPSMCYEASFPSFTREALAAGGGGDVLLNLTNDVWFGNGAEGVQHLMLQIPRTIENRRWLVRSTNSGISAFVDPSGVVRARTEQDAQTILAHELAITALAPTFYHRFGDLLWYLALALAAILGGWRARRNLLWRRVVLRHQNPGVDPEATE